MQFELDDGLVASLQRTEQCWLVLDADGVIRHRNPPASLLLGDALPVGRVLSSAMMAEPSCGLLSELSVRQLALGELQLGVQLQPAGMGMQLCRVLDLAPSLYEERQRLQRERYLAVLSELSAQAEKNSVRRLDMALNAGAAALGMDMGFITHHIADTLEIVAHNAPERLSHGMRLPLELAYCEATLRSGKLLALHDVLESELADSACYREFRLRSYIGVPLEVEGQRFGTLAFCGVGARSPFEEPDAQFVRHLARWVQVMLERKLAADELALSHQVLEEQLDWLRLAGQVARLGHWSYAPSSGWVSLSVEACRLLDIGQRTQLPLSEVERRMVVEDRQRWRQGLAQCLAGEGELTQEVRLRLAGGKIRWLSLRAQLVARDDGPLLFGVLLDISDAKEAQQLILYQASHDGLTGCVNRMLLFDRLGQEIRRCDRLRQPFSLLFIDLDYFKRVNDLYGHAAGDRVLTVIADRLMALLRKVDTVARVGGDEFVLLLPGVGERQALERLRHKVLMAIERPVRDGERRYRVSASIGIAVCPHDGVDPEALLRLADRRMYEDKGPARAL